MQHCATVPKKSLYSSGQPSAGLLRSSLVRVSRYAIVSLCAVSYSARSESKLG